MDELPPNIPIIVGLLLGEVGLGGQANLLFVVDLDHHEYWGGIIFPEDFINGDIVQFDIGACGIPTDNFFSGVDFSHHAEHLLVVDVVEKPDVGLVLVLFERHCETVCYFQNSIISIFSKQGSNNSFLGILGKSIKNKYILIDQLIY